MQAASIARVLAFGMAVLAMGAASAQSMSEPTDDYGGERPAAAAPELNTAMRAAWDDHISAMRDYALAVQAGDAAKQAAASDAGTASAGRIADVFAPFYGADAASRIRALMEGHCADVEALARAAHANDAAGERAARRSLRTNAASLARLLAHANPDWFQRVLRDALTQDIDDHVAQIDQVMSDAPAAEQDRAWADMREHARIIADAFANGIAQQFPAKVH